MAFQRLRRALLLAACASTALLAACGGGSVESQFTPKRIVAFGDGFSDLGQGGNRYTVNDGSVNIWTQQLALRYGVGLSAQAAGGTSYAIGNARVAAKPDAAGVAATPTVTEQIATFMGSSGLREGDLIVIGAGTADVVAEGSLVFAGNPSVETVKARLDTAKANLAQAGRALAAQVHQLVNAGADKVLVVGSYNLERSPWAASISRTGELRELSRFFNEALLSAMKDLDARQVLFVDTAGYFNLVTAFPGSYSMDNATTPVCTSRDAGAGIGIGTGEVNSALCTTAPPATLLEGVDYNRFVFADAVYPTPRAHRLFGDFVFDDKVRRNW